MSSRGAGSWILLPLDRVRRAVSPLFQLLTEWFPFSRLYGKYRPSHLTFSKTLESVLIKLFRESHNAKWTFFVLIISSFLIILKYSYKRLNYLLSVKSIPAVFITIISLPFLIKLQDKSASQTVFDRFVSLLVHKTLGSDYNQSLTFVQYFVLFCPNLQYVWGF